MRNCFWSSLFLHTPHLLSSPHPSSSASFSISILCLCSPPPPLVSLYWDLDNKPPKFSPYLAALHLRHIAAQFGDVVDMVACANRHAFLRTPNWVRKARQQNLDLCDLDRSWFVKTDRSHVCSLCGWVGETKLGLKRHFKEFHERERRKRTYRLHSLRENKKVRDRQSCLSEDEMPKAAARPIDLGYDLDSELRRAGVSVRTVDHKPQAADRALKKQIVSSMNRGVQCICLVSDDFDFSEVLKRAQAKNLLTVVIGDTNCLRQCADIWYSWDEVAQGLLEGIERRVVTRSLCDRTTLQTNSFQGCTRDSCVTYPVRDVKVPGLFEEDEDKDEIPVAD